MFSLTATQDLVSTRNIGRIQANTLAESGIHVMYDRIRSQMLASQTFPFSTGETNVVQSTPLGAKTVGTYDAKVLDHKEIVTDIDVWDGKVRRSTFTFTLESIGVTSEGLQSKVKAKFTAVLQKKLVPKSSLSGTPPDVTQISFPSGALSSNSTIDIVSDEGLVTTAPNGLSGHLTSNEGISWNTKTGAKSGVTQADFLKIQGQYLVPPGGPYTWTVSPSGMGNSNGSKNYQNPAAPPSGSFLGSPADTVLQLSAPMYFADAGQTLSWKDRWYGDATKTGFKDYSSNLSSSSITTKTPSGVKMIQAPARINGNFDIAAGDTVKLMPNSTNPRDNVIYVKGNVQNLGALKNLGCTLVVEGNYSDSEASDYSVTHSESPFSTRERAMNRSMLAVLGKNPTAAHFSMSGAHETGLVYALNGGLKFDGSAPEFTGAMIAGGANPDGGISVSPKNGTKFTMHYDPYATSGGPLLLDDGSFIDKDFVVSGVYSPFDPQRLRDWAIMKP